MVLIRPRPLNGSTAKAFEQEVEYESSALLPEDRWRLRIRAAEDAVEECDESFQAVGFGNARLTVSVSPIGRGAEAH